MSVLEFSGPVAAAVERSPIGRAVRVRQADGANMIAAIAPEDANTIHVFVEDPGTRGWERYGGQWLNRFDDWRPLSDPAAAWLVGFAKAHPAYAVAAPDGAAAAPDDWLPPVVPAAAAPPTHIGNVAAGLLLLRDHCADAVMDVDADGARRIVVGVGGDTLAARREAFRLGDSVHARLAGLGWERSPLGDGYFYILPAPR